MLNRLRDAGNTVIVIEHNLDVIKCADHIIDLGPEEVSAAARWSASATPEQISDLAQSHTGRYLKRMLVKVVAEIVPWA